MLPILAFSLALGIGAAGCGASTAGTKVGASPAPSGSSASSSAGGAKADLKITVVAAPGTAPSVHTLTCDPTGGNLPNANSACALLARTPAPFAATRPGVMCGDVVSGEQTATVTGTLAGKPVNAKFSRVDTCQTARWMKIAPLLAS
jgi:hypothetical protein